MIMNDRKKIIKLMTDEFQLNKFEIQKYYF